MATNQTNDTGSIALVGAAVVAVGAVIYAAVGGDSPRPVINIPSNFGGGSTTEDDTVTSGDLTGTDPAETTPDDLQDPADNDWNYEDPSDNPDSNQYEEDELDFGNSDPYQDGTAAPDGATTIPDSLADFDPAGRVDLVNQDSDDGGTWVGL